MYKYRITQLLLFVLGALALIEVQAGQLPDFSELAEKNSPAVVNISTSQTSTVRKAPKQFNMPDLPENSPFNELFKHFFGDQLDDFAERESRSLGSGFIISDDGYILTARHVVDEADEILVRLSDRQVFNAEVIGSDKASDVALLKIDASDLPTVRLGKSSALKVGEWVLAIGSPFGFDHTVTAGIVSAKGRSLPSENYVPFIQTDVAINPGNSGGPLFDLDGEVIGINSQIYSRTGGFMGLSFAIPIELAMSVADQLRTQGHVSRGYLGVLIQDVDRALAESFGLDHPRGALVARVMPDSPADKAGIQAGDIILEFNGQAVLNSSQLPPMVGTTRVDKPARLTVLRGKREMELAVTIGELPPEDEQVASRDRAEEPRMTESKLLGLSVGELTDEQRESLGLDATRGGVLVRRVMSGPAKSAGLRQGDVILLVDGEKVQGVDDFESRLESLPQGRSVAILVHRNDGPLFLALRIPADD